MPGARAYLDWNASAPLLPEARAAMLAALDEAGNPSSIHAEGRAARAIVEAARAEVAALAGGEAENVVFTSGATEAINAVLRRGLGGCCGRDLAVGERVIVGATEHAAVFAAAAAAEIAPVGPDGLIDRAALAARLVEGPPALVMIQLANNETGIRQDIPALAGIVHAAGGALVVDAVQGPGRIAGPLAAALDGADAVILSAHKFGGPKGVGALIFADRRTRLASALIAGGGQERGQRGGTENIPGIAGMGAAARAVHAAGKVPERLIHLRDTFENHLNHIAADALIAGQGGPRLANTSLFAIPGLSAEKALIAFDLAGVALSSGSACSSGKVRASHVLRAMGAAEWVIEGALRVSIGPATREEDLERCLAVLARQLRGRGNRPRSAA
ncbi:cysteine desulfurase family protein [Rhabdaerophilum calidifontis]|uniref:cysteine desulfurase family protein n=1 Tax=Rhabdaerophilum calidifontis TaxID=2604328 RepID=UPI00123ABF4C|nr:aminotransferase class V-fold PLP-dependent enzyme [Rhabdaerophilum calidifontis]